MRGRLAWLLTITLVVGALRQAAADPLGDAQKRQSVVMGLITQNRLAEAKQILVETSRRRPRDVDTLVLLSGVEFRLGNEAAARQILQRASGVAPAREDIRARIELLDHLARYVVINEAGPLFRVRAAAPDAPWLARILPPFLAQARRELDARYGALPRPVIEIIFLDEEGQRGMSGAWFLGEVQGTERIVVMVPRGKFNWGMMLWHELAHVYALQLADSRAPRWLLEGLAERETALHQPLWRRHAHAVLADQLAQGRLPSLAELEQHFAVERRNQWSDAAMLQAAVMVGFIEKRSSFKGILNGLRLCAAGANAEKLLFALTGLERKEFENVFSQELRRQLAPYLGSWPTLTPDELATLKQNPQARPNDVYLLRAQVLVKQEKFDAALDEFQQAARLDGENPLPLKQAAVVLWHTGKKADALDKLEAAARLDVNDASLPMALIDAYAASQRWDKVREAAELAYWIAPCDEKVRLADARGAFALGDRAAALRGLALALACAPTASPAVRDLLNLAKQRADGGF